MAKVTLAVQQATRQFNTTTSMGRLTLNVLLSFAQFEREVTSEQIRDKIAASKRKGIWVGGNLPLGYQMQDGKIAIVEEEAELVRAIYQRYLELGSVNELLRDLKDRNVRTKSRLLSTGVTRGGIPFGRGTLYYRIPAADVEDTIVKSLKEYFGASQGKVATSAESLGGSRNHRGAGYRNCRTLG